ncbi:MAG: hypothetical protein H6718_09450 [Polyangiaceae bacterium]|nr:hypothetical protein [Polyangiaceae bacterium]MCB9606373.1 hypothetical protein [Polyangiaceae bacterium]
MIERTGYMSDVSGLERLECFDAAWQVSGHGPKLKAVRKAAFGLRERFATGPRVVAVRTLPVATLAYPTKYAFWSAPLLPFPYVIMKHQCLLVQFLQRGELKNLLFNPTDDIASRETPFFKRMIEQVGEYVAFNVLQQKFDSLESQLSALGLDGSDIDYVAFDHFHTQDLRALLGTSGRSARFPNAVLLAPAREWDDWDDLHPMQKAWFVADGKRDVNTQRVLLTDADYALGDGVMLLRTPGHTSGNQTLFVNTQNGVWGCSENGTCADNWSPLDSKIPGLARLCRQQDLDVVINANTPELGATQYTSMVLERTLVDRVEYAPAFVQMFASSEVQSSPLAPGLKPTVAFKKLHFGQVTRPRRRVPHPEQRATV